MQFFITVAVLVVFVPKAYLQARQYYWQDYKGEIPDDALEGGYDAHGNSIFVGQARDKYNSLIPVTIYPNSTSVDVPSPISINVIESVNSSIKILCGDEQPLSWFKGNSDTLQVQLIRNSPIIGGKVDKKGTVHIGRVFYENEIRIGPVLSYDINHADLIFVYDNNVYRSKVYEVMEYERAPRPRRPSRRRHGRIF